MTVSEQINEWAGYIAFAAVVPLLVATFVYGIGAPWWRSWLGRTIFAQWASLCAIFIYILTRRFWGEYPGFEWWAVGLYSALFLAFTAIAVIVIIERRAPARALAVQRKESTMSDNTPIDPATPAGFLAQTRKAFVAGGAAAVATLGTSVAAILSDGKVEVGECLVALGAAIAVGAGAFAAVYRVPNDEA